MPLYEYKCKDCDHCADVYETMGNKPKLLVYCCTCWSRMKQQFSSPPMVSVPKSLGSKIDKEGVKMPKEWFYAERRKKQMKAEQDQLDRLHKDPAAKKIFNQKRKDVGLDPV